MVSSVLFGCWINGLLLLQKVDELDISVFAKVALELLLVEHFKVLDVADVDVPSGTRVNGKGQGRRQGSSVLSPSDLQATIIQGQPLIRRHLEECVRRSGINECHELEMKSEATPEEMM